MAASHSRNNPCPVCGGYGAGQKKRGQRCRGFRRLDGEGSYCEIPNDTKPISPLGFVLYLYKYDK